jgi:hypothetical protein
METRTLHPISVLKRLWHLLGVNMTIDQCIVMSLTNGRGSRVIGRGRG